GAPSSGNTGTLLGSPIPAALNSLRHKAISSCQTLADQPPGGHRNATACDRACAQAATARSVPSDNLVGADRFCSPRSEEHTSELQSRENLVCRLLLEKKK